MRFDIRLIDFYNWRNVATDSFTDVQPKFQITLLNDDLQGIYIQEQTLLPWKLGPNTLYIKS